MQSDMEPVTKLEESLVPAVAHSCHNENILFSSEFEGDLIKLPSVERFEGDLLKLPSVERYEGDLFRLPSVESLKET